MYVNLDFFESNLSCIIHASEMETIKYMIENRRNTRWMKVKNNWNSVLKLFEIMN